MMALYLAAYLGAATDARDVVLLSRQLMKQMKVLQAANTTVARLRRTLGDQLILGRNLGER